MQRCVGRLGRPVQPALLPVTRQGRRDVGRVLQAMTAVRAALIGPALCSAAHVEQVIKRATDLGVVWPSPVVVLLEDVKRRGGVLGQ